MNKSWAQHTATPGSIKAVYGAQYPPLQQDPKNIISMDAVASHRVEDTSTTKHGRSNFQKYEESVSDAWDCQDVRVDMATASRSASKVLEHHASQSGSGSGDSQGLMPNIGSPPASRHLSHYSRQQAMQRLATQKEPVPGSNIGASSNLQPGSLYPRLPDSNSIRQSIVANVGSAGPKSPSPQRSSSFRSQKRAVQYPKLAQTKCSLSESPLNLSLSLGGSALGREKDLVRFDRLRLMLDDSVMSHKEEQDVDLEQLRKNCWLGVPHKLRPKAWRLLSGYLPSNYERREPTLKRKREEYYHYVEQYFHTRHEEQHIETFRQIHIDIPRMCPLIPLFQQKMVQEIFERILYIWAMRHPASGYVQGINDLLTPFFVVFLSEFVRDDTEVGTFDVSQLSVEQMSVVEADSFWCISILLDTIQDNYTFAQPGIQRKVLQLRHLISRVDNQLHQHLERHNVEYLQFAFRWMNNLLMREIPLRATIRLWDTYLSERNGFSQYHGYVCAAFLRMWSKQLQRQADFQSIMLLLQNLPTQKWSEREICELTADAYSLMSLFAGTKNHLQATYSTMSIQQQ